MALQNLITLRNFLLEEQNISLINPLSKLDGMILYQMTGEKFIKLVIDFQIAITQITFIYITGIMGRFRILLEHLL